MSNQEGLRYTMGQRLRLDLSSYRTMGSHLYELIGYRGRTKWVFGLYWSHFDSFVWFQVCCPKLMEKAYELESWELSPYCMYSRIFICYDRWHCGVLENLSWPNVLTSSLKLASLLFFKITQNWWTYTGLVSWLDPRSWAYRKKKKKKKNSVFPSLIEASSFRVGIEAKEKERNNKNNNKNKN